MLDGATILRARPDLVVEELDGELVVLDPRTSDLHHLDPVATTVWWLFDGLTSVDSAIRSIVDRTAAPREVVTDDVTALLEELLGAGLMETLP